MVAHKDNGNERGPRNGGKYNKPKQRHYQINKELRSMSTSNVCHQDEK